MKKIKLRSFRYFIQYIGILLTIIGIFSDFPILESVLLGLIFIMGPVFCGWICPFGTLQDLSGKIGSKLKIKKRIMPKGIQKTLSITRYIFLGVSVFISLDFVFTLFSYDPRSNLINFLTGYNITVLGWLIIIGFILLSIVYERPFCNFFCVEGAKYGLIGSVRPVTITRNEDTCIECGLCNKACPMHIDVKEYKEVRSLQCINCFECISACPVKNTLKLEITTLGSKGNKLKTIVTSFLIVLGIGYIFFNTLDIINSENLEVIYSQEGQANFFDEDNTTSSELSSADVSYIDGIYNGTGTGFRGVMDVEVTISNGLITSVEVTDYSDDKNWFERAYETITSSILESQSTEVDIVTGATYSSIGIIESVDDALSNAVVENSENKGDSADVSVEDAEETISEYSQEIDEIINSDSNDAQGISDGIYTGTGSGFRGDLTVEVTVENELITQVSVIDYSDDENWFQKAYSTIVNSIIEEQTTDVDIVTGATYSSTGIKEAVSNALIDAGGTNVTVIENNFSVSDKKSRH